MGIKDKYHIKVSFRDEYLPWLIKKHYAKREPSISYAYGLYDNKTNILQGVCTFGKPGGSCLSKGLFSGKFIDIIFELNRLVIENKEKNILSYFVAECLKKLPQPMAIVSFADDSQGHHGYIYQATNWIYTGLSAKRTEWVIDGFEHLHSKSIADKAKKGDGRWERFKSEFGEKLHKRDRPQKHRYIMLLGNKKDKKNMIEKLKYKKYPYPKGDNKNYDASFQPDIQMRMF